MVSCASCGYSLTPKNKNSGVTCHRFPKDQNRRTQWSNFMKKPGFIPKRSSFLCSLHFAEDCFDRTSQLKVRLQPGAIPTIEVERLKYGRLFKTVIKRFVGGVENKLTDTDILFMPGPSVKEDPLSPRLSPCPEVHFLGPEEDTSVKEEVSMPCPGIPFLGSVKEETPSPCPEIPFLGSEEDISVKEETTPTLCPEIPFLGSEDDTSGEEETPSHRREIRFLESEEDTPCIKALKRTINDLQKANLLQSHQIRRLQKANWRQKKQISSLKVLIANKNFASKTKTDSNNIKGGRSYYLMDDF